ncbi:MAG: phosphatase PAP2 family protein [Anaerolineae bacterium]|nr:phosphatase PAP2 family protein [Anaerolineae bacterium]
MESIWSVGIDIIYLTRAAGDWLVAPMRALSALGQAEFYLILIPWLYWCLSVRLGQRVGTILLLSVSLNEFLKVACHQPRPYWVEPGLVAYVGEANFGLPSGHAQHAVSIWGLLAVGPHLAERHKRWFPLACMLLIALIGLSRMYLGVHFPTDVAAGWLLGGVLLWAFLRWEPSVKAWINGRRLSAQLLLALVAPVLLFAPVALAIISLRGWDLPMAWQQNALLNSGVAIDPWNLENVISMAGVTLGLALGAIWMARRGGLCVRGAPIQLCLRYLLGLLGVVVLWYGLRMLTSGIEGPVGMLVRYARYAAVGFWVAGAGPACFMRLGLISQRCAA